MRWSNRKTVRIKRGAIDLAADINATVAINAATDRQVTCASSRTQAGVDQDHRRTGGGQTEPSEGATRRGRPEEQA